MQTQLPPSPVLTVDGLSWSVGGQRLLDDIGFSVPAGKMIGLIGPNGAGKSSLLRCLYRFLRPDTGLVRLDGIDCSAIPAREFARRVSVVQQDTPAGLDVSVRELVAMGLTPHKGWLEFDSAADRRHVNEALATVGLSKFAWRPFSLLSGGEKQRALIARAIVQQPQLLILDEPTNHLDIRYQIQILELVQSLGISVIASIHDLNLASALCDRLLLLDGGRLVAEGEPQQVLTEETIARVFGVCCRVSAHPQHGKPLISYFYGYHSGDGHGQ
ncbi:MAG: ABC transporter ATP-binding protein [Shewanella sp.]|nr:ABC transporter ATP-binding protein [Shewanella sp.]MCF1432171.1 ABC transporter ATP-binding protein [Shewanella sp.]